MVFKLHYKKSQTATEYLIILAVVIVIAIVVTNLLGGFPGIGSGVSENAARISLQTQSLSINAHTVTPARTFLRITNTMRNPVQLNSIHIDDRPCWLIGNHNQPHLNPTLRVGQQIDITCGSFTAPSNSRYQASIVLTYTDLSTNVEYSTDKNLFIVGRSATFNCPEGFIPVPGGFVLADGSSVSDFCVSKYNMKWDGTGSISNVNVMHCGSGEDYSDNSCLNDNPGIVSKKDQMPLSMVNWYDAKELCENMGEGFSLVGDREWMTIGENIIHTRINDLTNSDILYVGWGFTGISGSGSQSRPAYADPIVNGCNLDVSLEHPDNAFSTYCQLRGDSENPFGFYLTERNWDDYTYSGGRNRIRTHVLSNGEIIWDFSGNIFQWTLDPPNLPNENSGMWHNYNNDWNYAGVTWVKPSILLPRSHGFGTYHTQGGAYDASFRGGYWGHNYAGIFTLRAGPKFHSSPRLGFRCMYRSP